MKKRLGLGILAVCTLLAVTKIDLVHREIALGEQKQETTAITVEQKEQDVHKVGAQHPKKAEKEARIEKKDQAEMQQETYSTLDADIQQILKGCSKEFISQYLIDESFLIWFYSEYGEDAIHEIVSYVEKGQKDPQKWYDVTHKSIHVLWAEYCKASGYQLELGSNIIWKETADPSQTVLDFTGDINFSEGWSTMLHMDAQINGIYECFSKPLLDEMNGADIMMLNNEFTYSTRGVPQEGKAYVFRADPSRVQLLQVLGADIVGLANNHICDYGDEALCDTLDTLKGADIPYVGAGRNKKEATTPVFFIANGRKIAIVAATQVERTYNYTKEATDTTPGVLKCLDPELFCETIRKAKEQADYVIAFTHWGTEGTNNYEQDQEALAQAFVDAGADAIIGGHTHCLQGIQFVKDVPVIYSLGNFWFNGNMLDTGMAQLVIHEDGSLNMRFLPCQQAGTNVSLVTEPEKKQEILNFMQSISAENVAIDPEGNVSKVQ